MSNKDKIVEIINNAKDILGRKKKAKRSNAMFFCEVMGGSTCVVRDVLKVAREACDSSLDRNHKNDAYTPADHSKVSDSDIYDWLIGSPLSRYTPVKTSNHREHNSFLHKLLKCIVLIPLWIILTPVFYIFHCLINAYLNSQYVLSDKRISKYERLEFPLAFAVLSEEKEMVKIFLDHKVDLDSTDSNGHNVMHYLADLSAYDLPKARECYKMLWTLASEGHVKEEILTKMILKQDNIHKQNAIEYCYQFGGLKLGIEMLHDTMTTCKPIVEDEQTILPGNEGSDVAKETSNQISARENTCRVKTMNVTQYTSDNKWGFTSFILHLMNSRPTTDVSKENWESVQNNKGIQQWMKCKVQQWKVPMTLTMILEFVVTFLLVFFLLNTDGDMYFTPNKEILITNHVQTFLTNWQRNDSSTAGIDTSLRSAFFAAYSDLEQSLAQDQNSMDYTEMLELIRKLNGYQGYSSSEFELLYNQLCVNGSVFQKVGDLVYMDNCTIEAANALLEDCRNSEARYGYYFVHETWDPSEFVIASSFQIGIYNDFNSILKNGFRFKFPTWSVFLILFGLAVYFCVYLAIDIYCRLAILVKQIVNGVTWYSIFATPIPGSYVKGHCKVFICFSYILLTMYYLDDISKRYSKNGISYLKQDILSFDRSADDNIRNILPLSIALVLMLVCTIILHLYSFRLFPLIGNFVITTFEMATDLFQFTLVYLLIVIVFSALFHWFSRSTTCPFFRDDNNKHLGYSIFTTFAATFGHVDLEFTNFGLRIVYTIFVVMSIILLLNLIIAVMSSTASEVTVEPWKTQLFQEALNSEALGIEHWLCAMSLYKNSFIYWTIKETNFEFDQKSKADILIEYFEEPSRVRKNSHM